MTTQLQLPSVLQEIVDRKVADGSFESAQDVIREALELLDEWEKYRALKRDLAHAEAQFERGQYRSYGEGKGDLGKFFADIQAAGQRRLRERSSPKV